MGSELPRPLFQFGYALFAGDPLTFEPLSEVPVPAEYILGPGDELNIQFYGKKNDRLQLVVDRSGMIELPDIGTLSVAGLSFSDMKSMVAEEIRKKTIGNTVSVSMGSLRSMRIFVLGDVNHPGSYMVSSFSTISNALFISGGISKQGSMRKVKLKREGETVAALDLYDFLLQGNSKFDQRLQAGDVIFVEPIGKTIAVSGEVNRPAIYELKDEKYVGDILKLAGGVTAHGDVNHQNIDRIDEQGNIIFLDVQKQRKTKVRNGDIVIVHAISAVEEGVVELFGQVKRPGKYGYNDGMTIRDIIHNKGDLLSDAFGKIVLIERHIGDKNITNVVRVDLDSVLSGASDATQLVEGDKIYVFSQQTLNPMKTVVATGEFMKPGTYPLGEDMTLTNLVLAAGGVTEKALIGKAELTRFEIIDGQRRESQHIEVSLEKALSGDKDANIRLQPYDVVTIRQVSNWRAGEQVMLSGEVMYPGAYPIEDGEKLSNIIKRSGGFSDKAYLKAAVFTRESIREEQQQQIDDMAARMEAEIAGEEKAIATLNDPILRGHKEKGLLAAKRVLEQMKQTKALGRLVIKLEDIKDLENSEFNLTLRDGDRLYVPKKPDEVTVIGQVYNTTALLYRKKYDLDDYIDAAGGITRMADEDNIYVVRANGFVDRAGSWGSTRIYPGDAIVVPEELNQFNLLDSTLDWSRVLMQIGVGLAAYKTIGVF